MAGNIGIEYASALTYVSRFHPPRLTYCYVNARGVNVKAHEKHPAPKDLSASHSEAARSECVVPEKPPVLGSSSFITDATGYAVQHLQYLPYGETFVDQQSGYDSRYTFSAKEKDDETQYSYFGARYYDSDLSVWLSVDRFADKYPYATPYMYVLGNPVKYYDNNGDSVWVFARKIVGVPLATHTFIKTKDESGNISVISFGPEQNGNESYLGGSSLKRVDYSIDASLANGEGEYKDMLQTDPIFIQAPEGQTDEEFTQQVLAATDAFGDNPAFKYNVFTHSESTGNCNTSTTTILWRAGVSDDALNALEYLIPGADWGFGTVRPWSAPEQAAAIQKAIENYNSQTKDAKKNSENNFFYQ